MAESSICISAICANRQSKNFRSIATLIGSFPHLNMYIVELQFNKNTDSEICILHDPN